MQVLVSRHKDRVICKSPWKPGIAEAFKSISGANWSPTKEHWSYPLTMHTLRSLREVFGTMLAPDAEILAWAKEERARERFLTGMASRTDATLGATLRIAPGMGKVMADRKYQRVGAAWGARAESYLLADEPGLGKTVTVLSSLMESGAWPGIHLAVAPKSSLFSVWAGQLRKWTPAEAFPMPEGPVRRQKVWEEFLASDAESRFVVVNPAMIRRLYKHYCKKCEVWAPPKDQLWPPDHYIYTHNTVRKIFHDETPFLFEQEWSSVIVDESHQLFAAYTPSNETQSVTGALDLRSGRRIAMTGTPLRGEERRIWGTLDWLGYKTGGYWSWIEEFFEVSNNGFGKRVHGLAPERSAAFYLQLDRLVLRRTRKEVRPDLPEMARYHVMVEMADRHRKQYEDFRENGEVLLEEGGIDGLGMLSALTRLKQMAFGLWTNPTGKPTVASSPKVEWLIEWLGRRGVAGSRNSWFPEDGLAYKYVVASQWEEIIDFTEKALNKAGIKTLKITGGVTGDRRTQAQAKFQSKDKEFRVILINTMAGGASIELDAWCDEGVILDETFIADDQVQVEGRYDNRSGRVSPRSTWYVRTAGTIEEAIGEDNFHQESIQHKLLDGRRGVALALRLVRGEVIEWNSGSPSSSATPSSRSASTSTDAGKAGSKPSSHTRRSSREGSNSPTPAKPRHRRRRV